MLLEPEGTECNAYFCHTTIIGGMVLLASSV